MSVCLAMIVRNESPRIKKCLDSVMGYIDSWVIIDTGSSDGTQELIQEKLKGIPGELFERRFVDFSAHRNEIMHLAQKRAEYALMIDADETFSYPQSYFPKLDRDGYVCVNRLDYLESYRFFLMRTNLGCEWRGSICEELHCPPIMSRALLEGALILSPSKERNPCFTNRQKIDSMQKELSLHPHRARTLFCLARIYEEQKNWVEAIKLYDKRIVKKGEEEEVYYSWLRKGAVMAYLHYSDKERIDCFLQAMRCLPKRAEAYSYLADLHLKRENYPMVYLLAKKALELPFPEETLSYVETGVYQYGRLMQIAESAWRVGRSKESFEATEKLLAFQRLPSHLREAIEKNRSLPLFETHRVRMAMRGIL